METPGMHDDKTPIPLAKDTVLLRVLVAGVLVCAALWAAALVLVEAV